MSLLDKINRAIDLDYDSKNKEVSNLINIPLEERILKGDTISNLKANFSTEYVSNKKIYFKKATVYCELNNSKFRIGSPVVLSGHNYSFKLEIIEEKDNCLVLYEDYQTYVVPEELNNSDEWHLNPTSVDIRTIVKGATSILKSDPNKFSHLKNIFEGKVLPGINPELYKHYKNLIKESKLNKMQQEAFSNSLSAKNYFLIQGPPGTGKTYVLAHIAHQLAQEGKKVLITAFTHTAINNALDRIAILFKYTHLIKVSKKNQGSAAKLVSVKTDFNQTNYNNSSKGIIVGATCYAPFTKKLSHMNWDYVIIDEAGQVSIPLAIAAMVKSNKYIFIGDHKQLPPIIPETQDDPVFMKSIFEHLFNYSQGTMLDTTYRMNESIAAFPSKQFYSNNLRSDISVKNATLKINNSFLKFADILDSNKPEVLICHSENEQYPRSAFEAKTIAVLVKAYLQKGISPLSIAILTPIRAQVREMVNTFSQDAYLKSYITDIFIDTVEQIQGQERDIVFFSLSISDPIKAKQRVEFFLNPNRLNVALTRSRLKRIVIGHKSLFFLNSYNPSIKSLIKNYSDFYHSSYKVEL